MIIETDNLTKHFRGHDAVNGISLAVPQGAALALIGANGAGKTTTLRMLLNILSPDAGSARVMGIDSRQLSYRDLQKIGYVSENQKIPDRLSVSQYFDYLRPLYPTWDGALEKELRSKLELPAARKLGKLSHGMRMKTLLAAALSFRPSLLILDEPLSGLDPLVRDEMVEGLIRQVDETTILISSHELAEIESCTTHVAFMDRGRLLFQQSIDEVSARFRDVRIVLERAASNLGQTPASWLSPQISHGAVHFVEAAFAGEQDLISRASAHFGPIRHCDAQPMSLREISKTLIRATRAESQA